MNFLTRIAYLQHQFSQEPETSQDSVQSGARWDTPLTKALGTKEKAGRARGVGAAATWNKAFPVDPEARRQRRRSAPMDDSLREEVRKEAQAGVAEEVARQVKLALAALGILPGSLPGARAPLGSSEASASDIAFDATHPLNNITV